MTNSPHSQRLLTLLSLWKFDFQSYEIIVPSYVQMSLLWKSSLYVLIKWIKHRIEKNRSTKTVNSYKITTTRTFLCTIHVLDTRRKKDC